MVRTKNIYDREDFIHIFVFPKACNHTKMKIKNVKPPIEFITKSKDLTKHLTKVSAINVYIL